MPVADRLADLERRVALLESRASVLHDLANRRVLDILKDFASSPFNDGALTLMPAAISSATGLNDRDLALALNALQHAGFVELTHVDSTGHWRITEEGKRAVNG